MTSIVDLCLILGLPCVSDSFMICSVDDLLFLGIAEGVSELELCSFPARSSNVCRLSV